MNACSVFTRYTENKSFIVKLKQNFNEEYVALSMYVRKYYVLRDYNVLYCDRYVLQ